MKYYIRGLSAQDNIPTGPFKNKTDAKKWLFEHGTDKEHIRKHFNNDIKQWVDFMVKPITAGKR